MIRVSMKKEFYCDKNKLWEIITNNEDYTWRSDLSKIEIIDETHFVEYTKKNFPTYFTITKKKKLKEYHFILENANLKGTWMCYFKEVGHDHIRMNFTEEIELQNKFMKPLAKIYLKHQQQRYIRDLQRALMCKFL